jgi:hypothetical protein
MYPISSNSTQNNNFKSFNCCPDSDLFEVADELPVDLTRVTPMYCEEQELFDGIDMPMLRDHTSESKANSLHYTTELKNPSTVSNEDRGVQAISARVLNTTKPLNILEGPKDIHGTIKINSELGRGNFGVVYDCSVCFEKVMNPQPSQKKRKVKIGNSHVNFVSKTNSIAKKSKSFQVRSSMETLPVVMKKELKTQNNSENGVVENKVSELAKEFAAMKSVPLSENIVKAYALTADNELLIEKCNQGSLESQIDSTPFADKMKYLRDIANALTTCHKNPNFISHADIAMRNILLHEKNEGVTIAKLSDFGLATVADNAVDPSLPYSIPKSNKISLRIVCRSRLNAVYLHH